MRTASARIVQNLQFGNQSSEGPTLPRSTRSQLPRVSASPRLLACLFVALLLGCERGTEKYEPEPNVHCLLRTNQSAVTLLAGMTVGYYDSVPDRNQWLGTSGVTAGIRHRDKVTALSAVADSVGYYATDSIAVVPGDSYSLTLTYPNGGRVTGSTVVPGTFSLSRLGVDTVFQVPYPGETAYSIYMSFSWNKSPGAHDYSELVDFWYKTSQDSILRSFGPLSSMARSDSCPFDPVYYRWDSLTGELDSLPLDRVRVEITARDRNYGDYVHSIDYMGGVDPDKLHLDGGVGVFGSACIIDSTLRFQPRRRDPIATSRERPR